MTLLALGAASLAAQAPASPQPAPDSAAGQLKTERPQPATSDKEEVPPEEDTSLVTTKYSFNPLQSKKDVLAGKFYARKGNPRAAALRYRDATRWDESNSEAWLLLAEAEEKLKDKPAARDAYKKYLELDSDAKNADDIRKKLAKLK
jgi:tetratricopeptide (TPR) repeat protein